MNKPKQYAFVFTLVVLGPIIKIGLAEDKKEITPPEFMQKQIEEAIKQYGEKQEAYKNDVLALFERKEKLARDKGDLKTLNLIKKEKDAFLENGKSPTLFFITDQKRFLELAKIDLMKAYEKTIKDCLKMKLDLEADGYLKELEELKNGKIKAESKVEAIKAKAVFLESPFTEKEIKIAQMKLAKGMGKPVEVKFDLEKGIKIDMVLIPPGKFIMGSPIPEVGRRDNEKQHEVIISKPFYMGKYEVTQEQWQSIMGSNPSQKKGAKSAVGTVSWNSCNDFIQRLNAKTNGNYRLPTEAEWEFACRAGTKTAYSFGNSITKGDANYGPGGSLTLPVGAFKPNGFGLHDMHGNVWEWCEDWAEAYPNEATTDPKGPMTGKYRILRGGGFNNNELSARSSFRNNDSIPNRQQWDFGLRLVKAP